MWLLAICVSLSWCCRFVCSVICQYPGQTGLSLHWTHRYFVGFVMSCHGSYIDVKAFLSNMLLNMKVNKIKTGINRDL